MLLLDTHVVLWLAFDPSKISKPARTAIEHSRQNSDGLALCDISLLEITTLHRKNRIQLTSGLSTVLSEIEQRFIILPITAGVCVRAAELPSTYPADPADRVIAATALMEGVSLITADKEIRRSRVVETIW